MRLQPILKTERLALTPASSQDLAELQRLWSEPMVRRFLFDDLPVSEETASSVLGDCLKFSDSGYGLWLMRRPQADLLVGCAGLLPTTVAAQYEPRLSGLLEPLAALRPDCWHHGYATEALAALCDYAFAQLGLHELAAVNDVPNEASARMLQRLGFIPLSRVQGPKYELQTYHRIAINRGDA